MRRTILIALPLLAITATFASASGLHLRWTACAGEGGVQNRTFACDTNTGNHDIIGSFVLDSDLPQVNGNELVVDLVFTGTTVPAWWQFRNFGTCRQTALTIAAHDGELCPDLFQGLASMNIAAYQLLLSWGPNYARILSVNGVAQDDVADLTGGQEYSIARWRISSAKTVGTGACEGCTTEATISFTSANIITQGNVNNTRLAHAASPGSNVVTWQQGPVPTRNSTWSAVKSLYR